MLSLESSSVKRALRNDSGQALGEVAIVSSLLILLLVGSIALGQYAFDAILLGNGSRAGVQYGAQTIATAADSTGIQSAVRSDVTPLAIPSPTTTMFCTCADGTATTCVTGACPANHRLTYVQVTTAATFPAWVTFPGVPSSTSLNSKATMQVISP